MTRLTVGDPAPLFELPDVDGASVRLAPAEADALTVTRAHLDLLAELSNTEVPA